MALDDELTEGNLDSALAGLTIRKRLGKGRTASVYEVEGQLPGNRLPIAVKVFCPRATQEGQAEREHRLGVWAHAHGLGPAVFGVGETDGQCTLFMEKMDATLTQANKLLPFGEAQKAWRKAFEVLAQATFCINAQEKALFGHSGWLCGDDLKPDNILMTFGRKKNEGVRVKLADWDPEHWHVLPLQEPEGRMLNRLLLVFNTIHCLGSATVVGLWPDHEIQFLQCLAWLAKRRDRYLRAFTQFYDWLLARGPYHYAGVQSTARRSRGEQFLQAFEERLTYAGDPPRVALREVRSMLRDLTRPGLARDDRVGETEITSARVSTLGQQTHASE